jgi:Fe-S-cluster-containing dehydrogenase component
MSRYKTPEMREYFRKYAAAHKEQKKINLENHRTGKMKKFYEIVGQRMKCLKCGESDIACLDFHHRNPAEKDGNVVHMARYGNVEKALAEAAKCDVLCSNCHRKLHYYE